MCSLKKSAKRSGPGEGSGLEVEATFVTWGRPRQGVAVSGLFRSSDLSQTHGGGWGKEGGRQELRGESKELHLISLQEISGVILIIWGFFLFFLKTVHYGRARTGNIFQAVCNLAAGKRCLLAAADTRKAPKPLLYYPKRPQTSCFYRPSFRTASTQAFRRG